MICFLILLKTTILTLATIGIQNVGNSYASNALTIPTTATMTTPKAQNTATDTATPDIASFVTSNGDKILM